MIRIIEFNVETFSPHTNFIRSLSFIFRAGLLTLANEMLTTEARLLSRVNCRLYFKGKFFILSLAIVCTMKIYYFVVSL